MLTRIISIILICSLIFVPTSVFASSGPGAPWDATYNWYNVNSDGSGDMNNGNVLYGLSQMSRSLMWIGEWIYDGLEKIDTVNSWLNSIYSNMNSYTSLIYDRVNGYLPTMSSNLTNLYNRVDSMYTNIVNISAYNNAQLTQLQQINTKLDIINSVNWVNANGFVFNGISDDGLSFINNNNAVIGDVVYSKISFNNLTYDLDAIFYVRLPCSPSYIDSYLNVIDVVRSSSYNLNILYYHFYRYYTDIYFTLDTRAAYLSSITFEYKFKNDVPLAYKRLSISSAYQDGFLKYISSNDSKYFDVLHTISDIYYLNQISNKLDNIEVSVDTSDIVDAINNLDITQDIDVDISQDITQTTNLITQLRNLFGTGVTIPQFVQQTQDQSLLGWFSQSNSDDINHISNGYNEAPY